MSLASIWRNRKPVVREAPDLRDTFHAYVTRYKTNPASDDGIVIEAPFGELKLCENTNVRRAPIATHCVLEMQMRDPYAHCERCLEIIEWQHKMKFGTLVKL